MAGNERAAATEDAGTGADFRLDGEYSLRYTSDPAAGGIERARYELDTPFGDCRYTVLGNDGYRVSWGSYRYRPGLSFAARTRDSTVALCFQLRGAGERSISPVGSDVDLRSGEIGLVVAAPSEVSCTLVRPVEGATCDVILSRTYVLQLAERHPQLLGSIADGLLVHPARRFVPDRRPITPAMWSTLRRIQRADDAAPSSLALEASIIELLALHLATSQQIAPDRDVRLTRADIERIHAARDLILDRLDDPPSLAELARFALMNEFKLKRGFRRIFGTSPYAYSLRHRLALAREYLLETDWTIAAIAHRIGYHDPAHFTNAFRRRYGAAPSDLRREHRSSH
ncbi:MAG TPA: AraC family transcriptional regulator [Longimicrobiales bacterium]